MRAATFIDHVQRLFGDPEGQFHKTEKVLFNLNTAIEDICTLSKTICTWIYIPAIKGQGLYGLPESYLETKYAFYYCEGQLLELTRATTKDTAPQIFSDSQYYNTTPLTYSDGGNAFIEKVVSTVDDEIAYQKVFPGVGVGEFRANAEIPTIRIGDRLINITDNSEGEITDFDAPNGTIEYRNLRNGETNRMNPDDEFRILSRTEHRHSIVIAPPPQKTDKKGAESIYVYYARTHIPITMDNIENQNDELEISTVWHAALRNRTLYYMAVEEKGIDSPTTLSFDVQYNTEYRKALPSARKRIRESISHWKSTPRRPPPRIVISSLDQSVDPEIIVE